MKKTFLMLSLLVAFAATASGAQIQWAIGGVIDATASIDTGVGSFILAYIGTTSGVGVDAATFNSGVGTTYSIVDTGNWSDFYSSRRQTYSTTKSKSVPDVADATYQVFYVNNGVYSLVNSPTISTAVISIDPVTGAASVAAYVDLGDGNGMKSTGGSTMFAAGATGGSAITSVPEPSVALMGLLGLGMLLKRRRA